MSIEADTHGRIYLSADLREKYGEKFHVVEYEDRLELIPIDADPLRAVREAAGDAFDGESVEDLKADALDQARREGRTDLEREPRDGGRR